LLRYKALLLLMAAACASQPPQEEEEKKVQQQGSPLAALPATFANTPSCDGCLGLTLTLRPDGSYLVRERLGGSEFYDFGRWRRAADGLLLEGGRDAPRRYALLPPDTLDSLEGTQGGNLRRQPRMENLRGPFRLTGLYDGSRFTECRTGLAWPVDESRAASDLKQDYLKSALGRAGRPALVVVDARLEQAGGSEEVRIQRSPAVLTAATCPG
jgi:NlpE C-terminal OB domain